MMQFASLVHEPGQERLEPSQTYGLHDEGDPGDPAETAWQVPGVVRLQASQPSWQLEPQQTPLTQNPEPHCRVREQLAPLLS